MHLKAKIVSIDGNYKGTNEHSITVSTEKNSTLTLWAHDTQWKAFIEELEELGYSFAEGGEI